MTSSLHWNDLVERCLLGSTTERYASAAHAPVADDVDPRYGLHGYSCTVELRNHKTSLWSEQFRDLNASNDGQSLSLFYYICTTYVHVFDVMT